MCDMALSGALKRDKKCQQLCSVFIVWVPVKKESLLLSPLSRTVESQLVSKMCRVKSVGVGTVVVDVEPAGAETDTHAGVDAPLQSLRTADFALQLVSMLLILLFLTAAMYFAYKRRRRRRQDPHLLDSTVQIQICDNNLIECMKTETEEEQEKKTCHL